MPPPEQPPVGMVAMLFTDIVGSTALAARAGARWSGLLAEHHAIVGGAIAEAGGWIDGTEGDAFFATFSDPGAAARAAVAAQRALRDHDWPPETGAVEVRMGLHVGHVERAPTGYVGLEVHRAARVGAAAHAGQLLLTAAARELVADAVPVELLGSHRLKDFPGAVQLYCAVIDGRGAAAFPPPRTHDVRPTNLPAGVPSLVGRDEDLELVRAALIQEGERLVSLTGRGGSGKTSLAMVAAAGLLDEHPGGVWWVNLSGLTSPDAVPDAIALAVGAERDVQSGARDAVIVRLRDSGPVLVVLDNLEHLRAACEHLEALLGALPELRLLVTTQVPLRLTAERVIPLDALDEPAALMLVERVARRRGAGLPADPAERLALSELVELLDGLPLALELAAARLALLSPTQLRDRLRNSLDVLKDSAATRPERQRSLQATVAWTLGLLEEAPRTLFARLGAFAGPVELEEIELVAGQDGLDVLEALSSLRDVALVRRVESGDGRIRFGLPEALRQIAARQLDAAPDGDRWRRAHAERQVTLVAKKMFSEIDALMVALAAHAEIAAALRWARAHDGLLAARIAAPWGALLANHGRLREAASVLAPVLEGPPEDPNVHGEALLSQSLLLTVLTRFEQAERCIAEAEQLLEDSELRVLSRVSRGLNLIYGGQIPAALQAHREATQMARALGMDQPGLSGVLIMEAQALIAAGELEEAERTLEEARRVGEASNASALRYVETLRGDLAMAAGQPDKALAPYARSLESAETRGDALQVYFDLSGMAIALAALERDEEALEIKALAEAQGADLGKEVTVLGEHVLGEGPLVEAQGRLGTEQAGQARARGLATSPGLRVARACEAARLAAVT